jgi:nicotinamide-nucleotide amidase
MRIEIICTGDEVLTGKTVNTNYSHMARRLQESGLDVCWATTIGDDRVSLVQAFQAACARSDAVIVNGGLGPTVDDLSQEVAAEAAGVGLELHESWLEKIEAFYTARGRVMPPNNKKQAMLPVGAEMIDNPIGTACGFAVNIKDARFFFTPGVPRELHRMLDEQIIPRLLTLSGESSVVLLKRFHSFGLGESRVDNNLRDIEGMAVGGEVKLGFQAHYPQLETKLFTRGANAAEVQARIAPLADIVRERLGAYVLGEDDSSLEGLLVERMRERQQSLAVAECGTHGAVAGRLMAVDDAGLALRRGTATSTIGAMAAALGVEPSTVGSDASGALLLARAARLAAGAHVGLCVVCTNAPTGGEGWVYIGVSVEDSGEAVRTACLVGGPQRVRVGGVEMGLDCLRRFLGGLSIDDLIDFEKQPA